MLKATFNSKYRKASGWVLTYAVTGTVAELEEYVAIMSARANKTPDQWQRTPAGNPLMFMQLNNILRNGEQPQVSYPLIKSHDGLNYYPDNTQQEMARYARIASKQEDAEALIGAELKYGIRTIGAPAGSRAATPTAPSATPQATPTSDPMAETIKDGLGEEEAEPVGETGSETLKD